MRHNIEIASVAIPPAILREVCHTVAHYCQQCIGAGSEHISEITVTNENMGYYLSALLYMK
jgi:hypothetical protein